MLQLRTRFVFVLGLLTAAAVQAVTYVVPADRDLVRRADGIVVATALESHAEPNAFGGIQTMTTFAVDEAIKGRFGDTIAVTTPGGELHGRVHFIAGAPRFANGVQYLVFLSRKSDGSLTTYGLGLGKFEFSDSMTVEKLLSRGDREAPFGWDPDGRTHIERLRYASRFLDFVRITARSADAPTVDDYFAPASVVAAAHLVLKPAPEFTRYDYLWNTHLRWKNNATATIGYNNAPQQGGFDGPAAANGATAAWNATGVVHYSVSGANSGTHGLQGPDGLNTILFNDPNNEFGSFPPGVVALGGITLAQGDYSLSDGSTYTETKEIDVVVAKASQWPSGVSQALFQAVIIHELGHTLGFRHADGTSDPLSPTVHSVFCAAPLPCSTGSQAIMESAVGRTTLGQWDIDAANTVYGTVATCTPSTNSLCIDDTRYRVTVTAKDPSGKTGDGTAFPESDVFGYFTLPTLADASDPQIFVKVIGPTPWVFYSGLTNLDYTITVVDTQTGRTFNTYHVVPPTQDPRNLSPFQSVGDYDVNGINAHDPAQANVQCAPTNVTSATTAATPANCANNATTLCLLNRFTVTMNAKVNNPTGATSVGNTIAGNDKFGFFTTPQIAGPTDVQSFIKMLDARVLGSGFWVFLGGLTDFELNFTVTDTQTGRQKMYRKPAGSTCGWNDTTAFAP